MMLSANTPVISYGLLAEKEIKRRRRTKNSTHSSTRSGNADSILSQQDHWFQNREERRRNQSWEGMYFQDQRTLARLKRTCPLLGQQRQKRSRYSVRQVTFIRL